MKLGLSELFERDMILHEMLVTRALYKFLDGSLFQGSYSEQADSIRYRQLLRCNSVSTDVATSRNEAYHFHYCCVANEPLCYPTPSVAYMLGQE